MRTSNVAALLLLAGIQAAPAQQAVDTSQYTLFDPVPDSQLRDFTPDRPGEAHTPITVDAGHIQLESDLWNYSFDHWSPDQTTTRDTILGDPNLKLGVTDWAELDAILPVYERQDQRSRTGGPAQYSTGQNDLMLGGKLNFRGNDPAPGHKTSAFGLEALVQLPTGSSGLTDHKVEFVVDTPYTINLPQKLLLTMDPGIGLQREQTKHGTAADERLALSLARPVIGDNVTAALELFVDHSSDHNTGTQDTIDPSLAWQIGKNLQLDAGAFIGLTKAATDYNPYVGIAWRY